MRRLQTIYLIAILAVGFAAAAVAEDICAICNKQIHATVYLLTDNVTGAQKMVCSNCVVLPRCFRCGLPVGDDGLALPDGRHLCARDAKVAVLDVAEARRICEGTHDDLDRLFARFTSFTTNVDVLIIDRLDVEKAAGTMGHAFESPDILGWTAPRVVDGRLQFKIGLLSGLPAASLRAISAHELSHTWALVNVPLERHLRLGRDTEEGFCEMIAYLLMDSQGEEEQKKFILRNAYTRGQVELFIEAQRRYGFEQILDWMKYGKTSRLETDRLEEVRDVDMPPGIPVANFPAAALGFKAAGTNSPASTSTAEPVLPSESAAIKLQGILWGNPPCAIINGHTVFARDRFKVTVSGMEMTFRCLEIKKNSVRIENVNSGKQGELYF